MEQYIIYFLKASAGIILFYFLYRSILRTETYYTSNRVYLMFGLALAVLLPLFPITYISSVSQISPLSPIDNSELLLLDGNPIQLTLQNVPGTIDQLSIWQRPLFLIGLIYICGVIIFLLRLIIQTTIMLAKIQKYNKSIIDEITIINLKKRTTPFSFFNVVFIDIQEYSERELSNIIAHEKVHILERHWIDLLIIELLTVLFWVNPVVWLYERSIKQNHEYLADQGVLLAGYHPGQYQALLINQLMGVKILGLTNSLNNSLNKKRMEMMKKKKSKSRIKLLLVLPVVAVLIFAFAQPEYVNVEKNVSSTNMEEEIVNQDSEIKNLEEMITIHGIVWNENEISLEGANVIVNGTKNGTFSAENGKFKIETPYNSELKISYVGYKNILVTIDFPGKNEGSIHVKMKKGIYNFILPDMTGFMFDKGLPPPPPAKRRSEREVINIVEKMPYMPSISYIIRRDVLSIMEKTEDRGEALVGFTINSNGNVINPYIEKSANSKILDASALKIIAALDEWEPGVQRGKKVSVDGTILVNIN